MSGIISGVQAHKISMPSGVPGLGRSGSPRRAAAALERDRGGFKSRSLMFLKEFIPSSEASSKLQGKSLFTLS